MTNIIQCPSVAEIDFDWWHRQYGIDCVLFDVDGTLAAYSEHCVPLGHIEALNRARSAGIAAFGLVTNARPRHKPRICHVASQVGANAYCMPAKLRHSKPSIYMIDQILDTLDIAPDRVGFVGDKLVDVLAATRAKLACAIWVERLGPRDNMLDRLLYRPVEPIIKHLMR